MLKLICSQIFAKFKFNQKISYMFVSKIRDPINLYNFPCLPGLFFVKFPFFILDDVLIFVVTFFFSLTIVLIADVFRF